MGDAGINCAFSYVIVYNVYKIKIRPDQRQAIIFKLPSSSMMMALWQDQFISITTNMLAILIDLHSFSFRKQAVAVKVGDIHFLVLLPDSQKKKQQQRPVGRIRVRGTKELQKGPLDTDEHCFLDLVSQGC